MPATDTIVHKTAMHRLLEVLDLAPAPLSSRQIIDRTDRAEVSESSIYNAISKAVTKGLIVRQSEAGQNVYRLALPAFVAHASAGATSPASLGLQCATTVTLEISRSGLVKPEKIATDILAVLDDEIAYTVGDIQRETGDVYTERDIRDACADLVARAVIRSRLSSEERQLEFWLTGSQPMSALQAVEAALVNAVEGADAPGDSLSAEEARLMADVIDVIDELATPVALHAIEPWRERARLAAGIRERVVAIARDLDEVVMDACDEQVPHGLLKRLLLGNVHLRSVARDL
ncbi:hypothetical protein [Lysobacter sp. CA199]|uniref:hypothetical protein n=1 Tax=Lysobacter sp. CA199 TaxID=3455608 RepID=UPI003F8D4074